MTKKKSRDEIELLKIRLLKEITHHVGEANAIGMGELYCAVTLDSYNHRINDTRLLRKLIVNLQDDGIAICSNSRGYWLASAGSELNSYCEKLTSAALKKLSKVALLKKTALPELLGQMQFDFMDSGGGNDAG